MPRALVLRVDLTQQPAPMALPPTAAERFELCTVRAGSQLFDEVAAAAPSVLIFDYDTPTVASLSLLRDLKQAFPPIPILMLTEHHSEALAVWALRARVWDYFVKPVRAEDLLRALLQLQRLRENATPRTTREMVAPRSAPAPTPSADSSAPLGVERAVAKAKAYVRENLGERIAAKDVADRCGMSPFHFSRTFKRVCGVNFSEYVLETRVKKAVALLRESSASVTRVCFDVGFRDLSYFGRVFRRFTGVTPTDYRAQYAHDAAPADSRPGHAAVDESTANLHSELFLRARQR